MKKASRIYALILIICMLLTLFPVSVFAADTVNVNLDLKDNRVWTKYTDSYTENISVGEYDKNIVTVEAYSSELNDSFANLSRSGGDYSGSLVSLKDCLYTFDEKSNGVYSIHSADKNGTTVYLNPSGYRAGDGYGFPGNTKQVDITVEDNGNQTFYLKDTNYLVYKTWLCYNVEASKTSGSSIANRTFALYRQAENGETSSAEIPGYIKISSSSEIESSGKYLIVAQYNGAYYVLYPSTSTTNRNAHVAKANGQRVGSTTVNFIANSIGQTSVTVGGTIYNINVTSSDAIQQTEYITLREGQTKTIHTMAESDKMNEITQSPFASAELSGEVRTDTVARLGTNQYYTGDRITLSNCLYTFNRQADGKYIISTTLPDSTVLYLNPKNGDGYPSKTASSEITVSDGKNGGFYLRGDAYLCYYRREWNCFNSVSAFGTANTNDETACSFLLYRKANDGETSSTELPGYVKVSKVEDGGQYVIVAFNAYDGKYYALYPTTNASSRNAHVARITSAPVKSADVAFTGLKAGTATYQFGNSTYNIRVVSDDTAFVPQMGVTFSNSAAAQIISKLTISVNASFTVGLMADLINSDVMWSSNDPSIATVENGKISAKSIGNTQIIATVGDKQYILPIHVIDTGYDGSANPGTIDNHISEMKDTRVWYAICKSNYNYTQADFTEAILYEEIYLCFNAGTMSAIDYFAKQNDGYALTNMSATASAGDYFPIYQDQPVEQNGFLTTGGVAGHTQSSMFGTQSLTTMMQTAKDMDCNGVFGFSRAVPSDLTFRSQKLPDVSKKVVAIGRNGERLSYIEGMNAEVGDTVYFMITVESHESTELINYNSAMLNDLLDGSVFNGKQLNNSTHEIINGAPSSIDICADLNADRVVTTDNASSVLQKGYMVPNQHKYFVSYTVTDDDLDTPIINKVNLEYTYQSQYSKGALSGNAESVARVTASSYRLKMTDTIVVDFGLPVKLDYSYALKGKPALVSGTASYADIKIEQNIVTYTPNQTLLGIDHIMLKDENGGTYSVPVCPATSVYYEEGFATTPSNYSYGFEGGSKGTEYQEAEAAGHKLNPYGYDSAYEVMPETCMVGDKNGNQISQFEFYGTGVDIYANCTADSGRLTVTLKNLTTGKLMKILMVETATKDGSTSTTIGQKGTANSLPLVSIDDLERGHYALIFSHAKPTGDVLIDGFRVYGTVDENNEIYKEDGEDNPKYAELRDHILSAHKVIENMNLTPEEIASKIHQQAYKKPNINSDGDVILVSADDSKWVTENSKPTEETEELETEYVIPEQDLLMNGPKNELYLRKGQAIVFKVDPRTTVQLGLKAYNNAVNFSINNGVFRTLTSHTDMFYAVENPNSNGSIVITNSTDSDGILSITKIKLISPQKMGRLSTNDVSTDFMPVDPDDLIPALESLGISNGNSADRTELNSLIKSISPVYYTTESYAPIAELIKDVNNSTLTQAQVDSLVNRIKDAQKNLVTKTYSIVAEGGSYKIEKSPYTDHYMMATITADATNASGQKFSYWIDTETGTVATTYRSYSFYSATPRSFKAVYGAEVKDEDMISSKVIGVRDNLDGTFSMLVEHSASSKIAVNSHGVLFTYDDSKTDELVCGTEDTAIYNPMASATSSTRTGLFEVRITPEKGADTVYARPFVIDNSTGEVHYGSDPVAFSIAGISSNSANTTMTVSEFSTDEKQAEPQPSLLDTILNYIAKIVNFFKLIFSI